MISRPDFQLKAKISTLLFPIANKLWLQSLKQQKRRKAHHLKMVNLQMNDEEETITIQDFEKLQKALNSLTKECQQVLRAFYYKNLPFKQIEKEMGYSSGFGRLKRKRCVNALKKQFLQPS